MTSKEETTLLIPKDNGVTVNLDKTGKVTESPTRTWVGMNYQELQTFSNDPFWTKLRLFCFGFFWCAFFSLIIFVTFLIFSAPKCRKIEWWQEGPMYAVFSPSFLSENKTSQTNGFSGIESKLDYIVELGAKTVWLSPIYKSPMNYFGYDIEDFKDVDEGFGTIHDFKQLVNEIKLRDLKLVMDFVPNHSSDKHMWFQKSILKEDPYKDYYVWAPPKGYEDNKPLPPNNWKSTLGGSAWEWNSIRGEFYLHQFAKEQPDLNFWNTAVRQEMMDIMRFWLHLGVDGFRMDDIPNLLEDKELRDEPMLENAFHLKEYDTLEHVHTHNLPEIFDILNDFRNVLDEYSEKTDKVRRLMMAELYYPAKTFMGKCNCSSKLEREFPYNFYLVTNITNESSPLKIMETIENYMDTIPESKWVLGNHDHGRSATQLRSDLVDGLNMILLMLPGTAVTYNGEELGTGETSITGSLDMITMSHSFHDIGLYNTEKAGLNQTNITSPAFSSNINYKAHAQISNSHIDVYKALVRARAEHSVMYGSLRMKVFSDSVFAFTRSKAESRSYVVAVNWSDKFITVDLGTFEDVPDIAEVYIASVNFTGNKSKVINTRSIALQAKESIILAYMPQFGN